MRKASLSVILHAGRKWKIAFLSIRFLWSLPLLRRSYAALLMPESAAAYDKDPGNQQSRAGDDPDGDCFLISEK